VRLTGTDLLTLDVHASLITRLDDAATTADDAAVDDAEVEEAVESAGPLTLAIDVRDDEPEAVADTPAPAP
jgi:exoribonuclease-2